MKVKYLGFLGAESLQIGLCLNFSLQKDLSDNFSMHILVVLFSRIIDVI